MSEALNKFTAALNCNAWPRLVQSTAVTSGQPEGRFKNPAGVVLEGSAEKDAAASIICRLCCFDTGNRLAVQRGKLWRSR